MKERPNISTGEVWRDDDPRMDGRLLMVCYVLNNRVRMVDKKTGRYTSIRIDRLRRRGQRGYTRVS